MDATLHAAVAAVSTWIADLATRYPAYAANELYNKADAADDERAAELRALADALLAIDEKEAA
jgi:hypothetical protein